MGLVELAIKQLIKRKKIVENGGINSIPTNLKRFSKYFPGIEKGTYYGVTGQTKAGKSQLASYLFLYTPILYSYYNPDKASVKVFYYPLEESQERVIHRFISYLLYVFYDKEISPRDLRSTSNIALSDEIVNLINSDTIQSILKHFESCVYFSTERNPTGIYKEIKTYCENAGTSYYNDVNYQDKNGQPVTIKQFSHYEPNNENEYVIAFLDHISLLSIERSYTLRETINKMSQYFVELRNMYNITPVVIQQQAAVLSADNIKADLIRPTRDALSDSKDTSKDFNYLIGIFSPHHYKLASYLGYDISLLKDSIRFIELILSRDGVSGTMIATDFNGAVCNFKELPLPNDEKMKDIYQSKANPFTVVKSFFIKLLTNKN